MSMNHAWLLKTGQHNHLPSLERILLWCAATPSPKSLSYVRALFVYIPSPDTFAYNTIIRAHVAAHSSPSHAISFFTQMRQRGIPPDNFTFPFLLKACTRLQLGQDVHALILKLGFDSDVYVQNALVSFYGGCGSVELALNVFHAMHERDLVSWSSMIACFANNGFSNEALALFRQMLLAKNVMPDEVTILSVISAVSSLGALELGQWVHNFINKSWLKLTVSLGTALIDMYSRCGSVDKSIEVFDEMPVKNVQTWTALSTGLAVHGRSREALRVFDEMKKAGLQPDHISITGILVACSHSGLVEDGWKVFKSMKDDYGLEPMLEHYGCMVDLLGRAGLLCKAYEFVEKMPIRPNSVIWRTLLGACVNHNHLVLAEKVKKRVYKLDRYHDGDYVLLSNAYGGAGRWVEKANVRNSMRATRVNKKAGSSSISVDQIIHEFISGDNSHPQSQDIREFLDRILESIKDMGYTPLTSNVLHDIEEEEKEHTLGYHSEKLVVAFALLNVKDNRTIRVMKNIRICHDCHSFMTHVSAKFGREIIVRDRNRFHHFINGSCSCQADSKQPLIHRLSQEMKEEVNRCQIQEWYPKFKSVSIKTQIHELPESFVQYLLDDSGPFLLPVSISNEDALPNRIHNPEEEDDYRVVEGSDDESEQPSFPPSFPELELEIKESIASLGGAVFPKLNWSAPKDSAWISTTGTLRCSSFSEIALLLRSSDSLVHDLCHAYDSCSDKTSSRPKSFFIVLHKWYQSLQPEMEFRCFVRNQNLVGISQREATTFYPSLLEKKDHLSVLIEDFFMENLRSRFESENYTFDVYVTKDERVKVMDFNPWGAFTLPLMFTWEELEQNENEQGDGVEFRIVESQCGVRPGLKTAVPYDYVDTGSGSGWDQFFRNADEELQRQTRSPEAGA